MLEDVETRDRYADASRSDPKDRFASLQRRRTDAGVLRTFIEAAEAAPA
ncbi:hypothetical protein [Mobilicoccus pelagius]|nr:hypothetical protein [Mobilicoccus pelagius]